MTNQESYLKKLIPIIKIAIIILAIVSFVAAIDDFQRLSSISSQNYVYGRVLARFIKCIASTLTAVYMFFIIRKK